MHFSGRDFLSKRMRDRCVRMLRQLSVSAADALAVDAAVGRAHGCADRAALCSADARADAGSDKIPVARSDISAHNAADARALDPAVHERAHIHGKSVHELRRRVL